MHATRAAHPRDSLIRFGADVVVPREIRAEIAVLKGIVAANVMSTNARQPHLRGSSATCSPSSPTCCCGLAPRNLDAGFAADWDAAAHGRRSASVPSSTRSRRLTDQSAMSWHTRLT